MKFRLDPLSQNGISAVTQTIVTGGGSSSSGGSSHDPVTLAGEDYLSLSGQQITANAIDLDNLSATGTPSSSTFLRGDNTWATPAGSGDVSKVGTPVNNQIGVWTGDGTLEGDADLTFDTATNTLSTVNIAPSGTVDGRDVAADGTKLDGIEALADVTDATNVAAAGAVMESDTSTASMSFVIDEDNMASNSATKVPTQQSVKAYVDASGGGSGDVVGPASSTDNALAVFDGTDGKLLENSTLIYNTGPPGLIINAPTNSPTLFLSEAGTPQGFINYDVDNDRVGIGNNESTAADAIYLHDPLTASSDITVLNDLKTDQLLEATTDAGVTMEGLLHKDSTISSTDFNGITIDSGFGSDGTIIQSAGVTVMSSIDGDAPDFPEGLTADSLALTTDLSVPNGGTGASTLTGLLQGNGTSPITGGATINNANWSGTDLSVANGGTGVSTLASGEYLVGAGTSAVTTQSAATLKSNLSLTKGDVGLGNVDNTSDATKANSIWPIGTIYTNRTNSANPSTYLLGASGQTWVAITDKMIMARGGTYSADGGAATHTHALSSAGQAQINFSGTVMQMNRVSPGFTGNIQYSASGGASGSYSPSNSTGLQGATDAGSTIPPMIVAYVWERTA